MTTIAFLGTSHIHAPDFFRRLKARDDLSTVLFWEADPERAKRTAHEWGFAPSTREAILSNPEVAGVIICSETRLHEELVTASAQAGKHMFVEKPLGMGARDSRIMQQEILKAGVLFQTGFFMRNQAVQRRVHDLLEAEAFGTVTRARLSNCHSGSLAGWFDSEWRWMADPAAAGVGAFGDLGYHILDLLQWHLGPAAAGTALLSTVTGRYGDCDETGEALLRMRSGVIATLAAGWVDRHDPVTLHITGTEGHALIRDGKLYVHSGPLGLSPDLAQALTEPDLPHPFEQFLDALSAPGNSPALLSPVEAAETSVVMEGLYHAARTRTWVDF